MPEYKVISYEQLEEPEHAHRSESLMHRMDELKNSIRELGLVEPIIVEDLQNGTYRVWAGHRRSIACTLLQKTDIPAMVYERNHPALERIQFDENRKRNRLTDAEETRVYHQFLTERGMGVPEIATFFDVPASRVQARIDVACGDPGVYEHVQAGRLSISQALEINRFESQGFKLHAIERCLQEGCGAEVIRRWRVEIQRKGVEAAVQDVEATWRDHVPDQIPVGMDECHIGPHLVPLLDRKIYPICHNHYNVFIEGLEALGKLRIIEEAGQKAFFNALLDKSERIVEEANADLQRGAD